MPVCEKCGDQFPNRVKIDGKTKNLQRRRFCLSCSPFGQHNTSKEPNWDGKCRVCGKVKEEVYHRRHCRQCWSDYFVNRARKRKQKIVDKMGGKCKKCGYNKCIAALQLHHVDPSTKDMDFAQMTRKSWDKIQEELEKCILLCANCHAEEHYGG